MPPEPLNQRFARLLGILMDYSDEGPVDLDDLTSRFAIDPMRLQAELLTLSMCGLPPYDGLALIDAVVDEDAGVVTINGPDIFTRRAQLTEGERIALLTAAQVVLTLRPHNEPLRTALAKATQQLDIGGDLHVEIEQPEVLVTFLDAEESCRVVAGRYWSAHRDEVRLRHLEPRAVFFAAGNWYARCHDRDADGEAESSEDELKLFRLDRFESAAITEDTFTPHLQDEPIARFYPGEQAETVTVTFPEGARWVTENLELTITEETPDGFVAQLSVVGTAWLENLLLQTGGVVLAPDHLQTIGPSAAHRALARYR